MMKAHEFSLTSVVLVVTVLLGGVVAGARPGPCEQQFNTPGSREAKFREESIRNATTYLDLAEAVTALSFTTGKSSFGTPELKGKLSRVCYLRSHSLFIEKAYGPDIHCKSTYIGQWLTAKESGINRPVVAIQQENFGSTFEGSQESLMLHESFGALGFTDDEYQLSGAIVALAEMNDGNGVTARSLLRQLRKIETHETAPRYKTAGAEACYKWFKDGAGVTIGAQAIKVAGGTHFGGGGDPASLRIKAEMFKAARAYWIKNRVTGSSEADFELFVDNIAVYGIENMEEFINSGKIYVPIQIHFGKSKREYSDRPRKAAAYLYTSVMMEGPEYMELALPLLLDHVYCTRQHAGKGCKPTPLGNQSYQQWLNQPLP